MQVIELRIGNLVANKYGIQIRVSSINEGFISFSVGDSIHRLTNEEINPIPLTEELLLKFGFEKKIIYNLEYPDSFEYVLNNREFILCYQDDMSLGIFYEDAINELGITPSISLFKHVHQLQNLYFALTGEELKIVNQKICKK